MVGDLTGTEMRLRLEKEKAVYRYKKDKLNSQLDAITTVMDIVENKTALHLLPVQEVLEILQTDFISQLSLVEQEKTNDTEK